MIIINITKEIMVDGKDFFDTIVKLVLKDARSMTHEDIKAEDIKKGYSYEKRSITARVTITELEPFSLYEAKVGNNHGETFVRYEIKEIEKGKCEVMYSERFLGASLSKNLNYKLFLLFSKKRFIKRAELIIENIVKLTKEGFGENF